MPDPVLHPAPALITVRGRELTFNGRSYPCAIGRAGFASDKKEGDNCTPLGVFALRECWYRKDRLDAPETRLPLIMTSREDGWCDDPKSPDYNRRVILPYARSHETMWREDGVYDIVVPLGYNDDPVVPGRGSAIFMHLIRGDYEPTEGCIALAKPHLLEILARCGTDTRIEIAAS